MLNRRSFAFGSACIFGCACATKIGQAQTASDRNLKICTELVMADVRLASAIANNENAKNKVTNAEALSLTEKKWNPDRRVLNVDFLETPAFLDQVVKAASGWHSTMALRFQFGRGTPDVLVSFSPGGSWSYIGTDSLYYSRKGIPSMNFGWFDKDTPESEFRRTTLHEFGHALSLIHEHQHPGGNISWKREQVYEYYKRLGWSREKVDQNIFQKYDIAQVNGSEYDPKSIMHYPIPAELVDNPSDVVGWNDELSELDRKVIAALYGRQSSGLPN